MWSRGQAARQKGEQEEEAGSTGPDLEALEKHLSEYSYVCGYEPSERDSRLVGLLPAPPSPLTHPAVARWYTHMNSFSAVEIKCLPDPQRLSFRAELVSQWC